ncbi:MAG TPA: hypothetical protein DF613_14045 [Lachnospiraceae bacterium]|nr:hypothetical protein [Lachnospiraceae bacterium]
MVWLTTKEAAELLGYTERAVRAKATNKEYVSRYIPSSTGQGGKRMEVSLESLPDQAQRAYHNQTTGDAQTVFNTDYASTKEQRRKGESRALAVAEYRKFLKQSKKAGMAKKTEIMGLFVEQWNRDHDFQISKKSLYDWMKKSKSGQVEKLVDRRGGYNRGQSTIPKKYRELFNSLYLRQTKPTIESCYREVKLNANLNGDFLPGIKAFRNYVKNMDDATVVRAREGEKAFDDKCMPYMERDYSKLLPNQFWVSDHHLWDIFVRVPDGKGGWKLERPWGSYWMDMRTRKVMASIVRTESPNSDIVLCSFGLGVEHFGIPNGVRLDNGKDYKAQDMFYPQGKYIVSDDEKEKIFTSLAANLQIEVTYAIPYNAKAKPIERLFNTFEGQLGKMYPSYAGSNAKQRPEDLKNLAIMDVITLEEFITQHNQYVYRIYNETGHSGDAMYGKSPNQVYADIPFTVRRASKEVLYFSLMRVKGQRVVQRNGVTFKGIHFYNDSCINYIGQKVAARYDPTKPEILYIFDLDENFLFVAEEVQKQGWDLTAEDYQRENRRKKIARQKAQNTYTADNITRSVETIGERLKRQAEEMTCAEIAKPKTIEVIRNSKIEENIRRISMGDIERQYEDTLKQNAARKKAVSDKQKELADKFKKKMLDRAYQKQA